MADPGAYGGDPAETLVVIVLSLPYFGFSTPLPNIPVFLMPNYDRDSSRDITLELHLLIRKNSGLTCTYKL
jgi:hypothetical protein